MKTRVSLKYPVSHCKSLIIWSMSPLEKWQLANEFSISIVNCDGNAFCWL